MKMSKIVQVKTPLELQEFLWRNGALLRAEDVNEELLADTVEHWEQLKTSRTSRYAGPFLILPPQAQAMWS